MNGLFQWIIISLFIRIVPMWELDKNRYNRSQFFISTTSIVEKFCCSRLLDSFRVIRFLALFGIMKLYLQTYQSFIRCINLFSVQFSLFSSANQSNFCSFEDNRFTPNLMACLQMLSSSISLITIDSPPSN